MQRIYDLGGLYALNLHPERGVLCRQALESLLAYAQGRQLPVWITSIGDIARWWKERRLFRFNITSLEDHRWRVQVHNATRATILARYLEIEDHTPASCYDVDMRVQSECFVVKARVCPCIALSQQTPAEVETFLYEQGYPVIRCLEEEASLYGMYLDKPEGLGTTSEEQTKFKQQLVEQIEALDRPLLHFGCWPDGCRAALAVSGDIDSITVQDFFLRIIEVFRHK